MYAELCCRSNFSFLEGACHPEELLAFAQSLGLSALAITDGDGLYAAVKAHLFARETKTRFLVASRLTLTDAPPLCVYVESLKGYQNLCQLLSQSRLGHPKGEAGLSWRELASRSKGLIALLPSPAEAKQVAPIAEAFPGRFYVGVSRFLAADDESRLRRALALAAALEVPACAHNDVHTHARRRQPLQDVLTAIRLGTTLDEAGRRLFPNAERTLKGPEEMARLFDDLPEAVGRTMEIADSCRFSLEELRYCFSEESLPKGFTPQSYLGHLTREGLAVRYPLGVPPEVERQIDKELALIEKLGFAGYFLALWDIVRFAREKGILCQGRGSAANSAVCYALQITAIDPVRMDLLFERFLSAERGEPPDIDVDFEHERREEVLQYVYQKHGRHRAAMVCEVICYRGKLAHREVGKALGLSLDQVDRLSKVVEHAQAGLTPELLLEAGLSPLDPKVQRTVELASQLEGTPRHLSIHVGGFVITQGALTELIPIENAAMKDRTVVQWEKDDLNAIGILKVDLLGLGMLTVMAKAFGYLREHYGVELSMATIPPEDPKVYEMICEADTIGVFQIESRAQMAMLPRLRPRTFYDLVIEVAIIRPGPIIGDMVHPYIRRRDGLEAVSYPSEAVREILQKTLGVPLFQEQAMKLAMVAAGFSTGEADNLRRILSHKRAMELLAPYQERFRKGCQERGYPPEFADTCFKQFQGFAHYGFPESHSASFALIAYASAYLKRYFPAAFTAALINSQPMGFYAAHTLVDDARRHGVEVRRIDVQRSGWDCTLELTIDGVEPPGSGPGPGAASGPGTGTGTGGGNVHGGSRARGRAPALRLGMRLVKGLREETARRIEAARHGGYLSIGDLARRAQVPRHELCRLALSGALGSISSGRREALWEIQALGPLEEEDLFFGLPMDETEVELPPLSAAERVSTDFEAVGLSLEQHPVSLLRPLLDRMGALTAAQLARSRAGVEARVGGMVIVRQRPPTAKGFSFLSLEDETGIANLIVEPQLFEPFRKEITRSVLLYGEGRVERSGKVVNLKVRELRQLSLDGIAPAPGEGLERLRVGDEAPRGRRGSARRARPPVRPRSWR
ncbi:MAG: error-prone DNA polymerase [Myxococcales bacterium]|nr:error-prone DNA polymerase [Myxococcales bacterium]